jgi:hypothetical protein
MRIATFALVLLSAMPTQAATIDVVPRDADSPLVIVSGDFDQDDIDAFKTQVEPLTKALVAFQSDGGNLIAGLRIGETIRAKKFSTIVPDNVRCASACALAWLGGVERFMGTNAHIGFHAAYMVQRGQPTQTAVGNAVMGAYLNSLGLPERAIVYITQAAPQSMTWLTLRDAHTQGIDVALLAMPSLPNVASTTPDRPSSDSSPDSSRGTREHSQARPGPAPDRSTSTTATPQPDRSSPATQTPRPGDAPAGRARAKNQ